MVCDKDGWSQSCVFKMVWDKVVCEKIVCDQYGVTKLCVFKMVCDKVVCLRWCVKDGV